MYEENNSQDTDEEKSSEQIQNDDGNDSQVKSVEDQGTIYVEVYTEALNWSDID